ncbi:hypothetical protein B296_00053210 [Ensete ventricosum]|uniref:Uncharacterized protein n=1 Tax=Ensete ventricosum TaxID=4639 RepID=A0A426XDQ8_ENSVE|nr:hypothetical protein B296_00053210 [Ensete ventricosum]
MSGDSELGLGGRLLEWWSPGQEEVLKFGSAADSCKKVRSAVRPLAPPIHPVGCLRRVNHADGPAVQRRGAPPIITGTWLRAAAVFHLPLRT